jgi:hypothetical protein
VATSSPSIKSTSSADDSSTGSSQKSNPRRKSDERQVDDDEEQANIADIPIGSPELVGGSPNKTRTNASFSLTSPSMN